VGLKTPEAIELNKEYTWASAGARRAEVIATLSRRENAEYLVVSTHDGPTNELPKQLTALGWQLQALKPDGYYAVYRLRPLSNASRAEAGR
jgi:broad specificity phosphatase PhoE